MSLSSSQPTTVIQVGSRPTLKRPVLSVLKKRAGPLIAAGLLIGNVALGLHFYKVVKNQPGQSPNQTISQHLDYNTLLTQGNNIASIQKSAWQPSISFDKWLIQYDQTRLARGASNPEALRTQIQDFREKMKEKLESRRIEKTSPSKPIIVDLGP